MAHEEEATRERLIATLGYQPRHIMEGMIKIQEAAVPSSVERESNSSASLGNLDDLPLELLHSIFAVLDFQTLSHISRTCSRGVEVVESMPQYRDLRRHTPRAMAALGLTRLIRHHSAAALHAALLSAHCASCGEYGPFLFLPTCERCCFECLGKNQSLWVIPTYVAKKCFGLTTSLVKRLPIMRSVPGKYYVRLASISRQRQVQLVSVRSAKELAVKQRSEEQMAQELQARCTAGLSLHEFYTLRWLQAAPLQPPGPELATRLFEANEPNDKYCGMASIVFPSLLTGNRIETGLWCRGCEKMFREWSPHKLYPADVSRLVRRTSDITEIHVLYTRQHLARSRIAFLDHITHCSGARELVPELAKRLRQVTDP